MINLIILSVGLIIYLQQSKRIGKTQVVKAVSLYVVMQVALGMGFLSESPILLLLLILAYALVTQNILFKYGLKREKFVYTSLFMLAILVVPIIFLNISGYEVGLENGNLGYLASMLVAIAIGYLCIKENECGVSKRYKYYVLTVIILVSLLNMGVYYAYHLAGVSSEEVIDISTCEELKTISTNNKYELTTDIDCSGTEVEEKASILPMKIEIEGNGHTISNLKIVQTGLIKINTQSKISRLAFDQLEIEGNGVVGVNYGEIEAVSMTNSSVVGDSNIGMVGINRGKISNSYSAGNRMIGQSNIGGIAGENYKYIEHVYSTSYVEGYEYVGGIVGHQGKPGKIENTFFDDIENNGCGNNSCYPIQNEENNISRGALDIIGQDRATREVIEEFENVDLEREAIEEHYLSLDDYQRNIIDEAYRSDSQDWYISDTAIWGNVSKESLDNIVVLSNQEYEQYAQAIDQIKLSEVEADKGSIGDFIQSISIRRYMNEYVESPVDWASIRIKPYTNYANGDSGKEVGGFYSKTMLEDEYQFNLNIWDYSTLTDESIGTYEPIKLKPLAEIA